MNGKGWADDVLWTARPRLGRYDLRCVELGAAVKGAKEQAEF